MGQYCTYNNMLLALCGQPLACVGHGFRLKKLSFCLILENENPHQQGNPIIARPGGEVTFDLIEAEENEGALSVFNTLLSHSNQLAMRDGRIVHPTIDHIVGWTRIVKERLC